ncbi:restriction endonuclease subunit S [Bacillus vallismortis]|uniref:restriction endonuclease subunit S n=1 Tax=Bacillus vallismortis TaxID=72361 RepID=UPI00227FA6AB|nr:restriction endonuclease subunit S [Bacillus vallismortis]MCY8532847.1 restriction endonuclease subunit S [Bacillus vallismortis]
MGNKRVPELRFAGFAGDWEERKLGELVEIKSGWAPSDFVETQKCNGEIYIKVDDLNYSTRELLDSKMKVAIHAKYHTIKKGSTIFPKRGAAIMTNKVRVLGTDGYMDTNMMALEPRNIDGEFLYTLIDRTGLFKIADTSTIPQINNKHVEPYKILLPNLYEQKNIGNFFKQIDNTIALYQQELTTLKQTKQGFLQKMFPKEGESVPEVRFPGFDGEWEKHRISSLGTIMTGSTPSTKDNSNYAKYGIIWVTPTDINSNIVTQTAKRLSKQGQLNARIVPPGTILITSIASIGKNAMVVSKASFNQQINSLTPNSFHDSYFLLTQSEFWSKKMKQIAGSGTMQIVNKSDFSNIEVLTPKLEEQTKIGTFFKQLDDTITLHQRELDALKETKKAFLQKMFV